MVEWRDGRMKTMMAEVVMGVAGTDDWRMIVGVDW